MTFYFTFIFLPGWDFDIIMPLCNLIAVVKIWVIENSFFFFFCKRKAFCKLYSVSFTIHLTIILNLQSDLQKKFILYL